MCCTHFGEVLNLSLRTGQPGRSTVPIQAKAQVEAWTAPKQTLWLFSGVHIATSFGKSPSHINLPRSLCCSQLTREILENQIVCCSLMRLHSLLPNYSRNDRLFKKRPSKEDAQTTLPASCCTVARASFNPINTHGRKLCRTTPSCPPVASRQRPHRRRLDKPCKNSQSISKHLNSKDYTQQLF